MKGRQNAVNIAAAIALFVVARLLDAATQSLKLYTGSTLNIQLSLWGYLGITLMFALLIFGFFLIAFKYQPPDRWVYASFLGFATILTILYVWAFMNRGVFSYVPRSVLPLTLFAPGELAGITTMILFWAGVGGLIMPAKK